METAKQFILDTLCYIKVKKVYITDSKSFRNFVYFEDSHGKIFFRIDNKKKILWVDQKSIWKPLQKNFFLEKNEIKELINNYVGETLNCKNYSIAPNTFIEAWFTNVIL